MTFIKTELIVTYLTAVYPASEVKPVFLLRGLETERGLRKIEFLAVRRRTPMFVSKMRSCVRVLGTWSEGVETQEGKKGRGKIIKHF